MFCKQRTLSSSCFAAVMPLARGLLYVLASAGSGERRMTHGISRIGVSHRFLVCKEAYKRDGDDMWLQVVREGFR